MANQDPITGIYYNFEEGSDGWTDTTNYNWRMLAFFSALSYVDDLVETLPSSPVTGAKYAHGTSISAYLGASWFTIPAKEGYNILNKATGRTIRFDGSEWIDNATAENTSYDDTVSELSADNVQDALDALKSISDNHTSNTSNPHSVTKTQVGLGNVDNTSDINKPVSTLTQTALNGKSDTGHNHDTVYVKKTDINGLVGNLSAPLTHLPLKKNLLTAQGQSIVTATRASGRTYKNRYGVQVAVANNVMCFDENGLSCQGAGTNYILQSEDISVSPWVKIRCTVVANTTETKDPFGTYLADKLVESTDDGTHYISQGVASIGADGTLSVFLKQAGRSIVNIDLYESATPSNPIIATFDLESLTLVSITAGKTGTIEKCADGWCRVSVSSSTLPLTTINYRIFMRNGVSTSYTGDGTSGLYIFGTQLEAMPFATSYIPTTTASATRVVNSLSFATSENMPYYTFNTSVVLDYVARYVGTGVTHTLLSDTSGMAVSVTTAGAISVTFGTASISYSAGLVSNTKYRIGITKTSTTLTLYLNGVSVATTAVGTLPANQTTVYIGTSNGSTNPAFGDISNLRIYDRALTAEEVRLA